MKNGRAFFGFSAEIDLRRLERESRRFLAAGFLFGVLVHAALGIFYRGGKPAEHVRAQALPPRPIRTELIELPPRDRAFYAVRRPTIVQRTLRPMMRGGMSVPPSGGFAGPGRLPGTAERPYLPDIETPVLPEISAGPNPRDFLSTREDTLFTPGRLDVREFSFRDEILSVEDFVDENQWRERGIVFLNPIDPLTIRGVVPIPMMFGAASPFSPLSDGVPGLAEAATKFSGLKVVIPHGRFILQAGSAIRFPFVYIGTGDEWDYRPYEAAVMGDYLKTGGFAVFDNLSPWLEQSPAEASLRGFIKDALGSAARMEIVPRDHPLYHCFFDFPDGPPLGAEMRATDGITIGKPVPWLEGIWIGNRLVGVYSNKGYGNFWKPASQDDAQLKIGINMLVYALIREGGKVDKRLDRTLESVIAVKRWRSGEAASPGGGSDGAAGSNVFSAPGRAGGGSGGGIGGGGGSGGRGTRRR